MSILASSPLRVQVLGAVRAWRGETELDLGGPRRRAVFAILALSANRTVSRDELVDGVWGTTPPASAVGILYTYVSGLRSALQPGRASQQVDLELASVGAGYSLRLAEGCLDERRVAEYREAAHRAGGKGHFRTAVEVLDAALATWQGDALSGISGPFAEVQRARLAELWMSTVEWREELRLVMGDDVGAVAGLASLVAEQPLRERPRGLLMAALYRSGKPDEALATFRDTERLLDTELGIQPGPALQHLYHRILANEPLVPEDIGAGHEPTAGELSLGEVAAPQAPEEFVGRESELSYLRSMLDRLANGRGSCAWLEGEPGIGKTALLATAFSDTEAAGCRVVWIAGTELCRHTASNDSASATEPRLAAVNRTLQVIWQMCAESPVVLVVDDLQSADDIGLLVWSRLTRSTLRLPLVLVGACRTLSWTTNLERSRNAVNAVGGRILLVGSLRPGEIAAFVSHTADARCGPTLADLLCTIAGNPLSLREVMAALATTGALYTTDDSIELDPEYSLAELDALKSVVIRRLGFLTAATQRMLSWAAVLGTKFDLEAVAAAMHTSSAELLNVVEEAQAAGVLVEADGRLAFRSPTVRRVIYQQDSRPARTAMHREAAAALADSGATVEGTAAQLLAMAPPYDGWSIRWLLANINTVMERDLVTAVSLVDSVLTDNSVSGDDRERLAVLQVRWRFQLGQRPDKEARDLIATARLPEHAAEMRYVLACLSCADGNVSAATDSLRYFEQDLSTPARWRVRCQTLRARLERIGLGDHQTAERTAASALRAATSIGDPAATGRALQELWCAATFRRDHAAALAYVDRALDTVTGTPQLDSGRIDLLDNRAFTLQNLDRLEEATETLAKARVLASRARPPLTRPHAATAVHYYWLGRWDEALDELSLVTDNELSATFSDLSLQAEPLRHGLAALIEAHRGDAEALRSHLNIVYPDPSATMAAQENSDFLVVAYAIAEGLRAGAAAELDAMAPLLDISYGQTMLRYQWLPTVVGLAIEVGDRQRIRAALELCHAEATRETVPARAHAALRRCQGLADGNPEPLLAAVEHYVKVGRPVERGATLVEAASVLGQHGELSRAKTALDDALAVFADLGAAFDSERAGTRMRRYGVQASNGGRRPIMGPGGFSETERRVAELAATGIPNVEIAAKLSVSRRTVQQHLSRVAQRLGAASRQDLVERLSRGRRTTSRS